MEVLVEPEAATKLNHGQLRECARTAWWGGVAGGARMGDSGGHRKAALRVTGAMLMRLSRTTARHCRLHSGRSRFGRWNEAILKADLWGVWP